MRTGAPPIPQAPIGGRLLVQATRNLRATQNPGDRNTRTVTFLDSYDALTPSSAGKDVPKNEAQNIVGYEKDPFLKGVKDNSNALRARQLRPH